MCANRHRGNAQSQAAYNSISQSTETLRRIVLDFIAEQGESGATCFEVSEILEMRYTTASARISELKARGQLVESGEKRPTSSGRNAAVLVCPVS